MTGIAGATWLSLAGVGGYLSDSNNSAHVLDALGVTARSALQGFVIGAVIAVVLGALAVLLPMLRDAAGQFAAVMNALPIVAVAPLLIATAGAEVAPVILAALASGFAVFVAVTTGLTATSPAQRGVFAAFGGSRWQTLARLNGPSALPSLADGFTVAAPAAMLGAIFGEWFGAPRGIGVMLVNQMQSFQMDALWATSFVAAALSLALYLMFAAVRQLTIRRMT